MLENNEDQSAVHIKSIIADICVINERNEKNWNLIKGW